MKKRYIFTKKTHPLKGGMSTILGLISIASLITVVYLTFEAKGVAKPGYGVTGFFAFAFSLTGLILGAMSLREKDKFKLFPIMGIVLNVVAIIFIGMILYAAI